MSDDVARIADNCFRLSLAHASWQALGFRRRPRRGVIARLTTPAWRKALEHRVTRELALIFAAAHIVALARPSLIHPLVRFYWGDGEDAAGRLFGSKNSCLLTINDYVAAREDWSGILFDHLEVSQVPDDKLRARLLFGCPQLVMGIQTMMLFIRKDIDMASWPKPQSVESAISAFTDER
jgi:hypothetical protein